jgi:putative DNA primase/helicase
MTPQLQNAARAACAEVGIIYRDVPADGRFHETDIEDDPSGKGDGRIMLDPDGSRGIAKNWKGDYKPFFADDGRTMTDAELRERDRKRQEAIKQAEADEAARHAGAAKKALPILKKAAPATAAHGYLQRKGIQPHGALLHSDGRLILAMRIGKEQHSIQFIAADGTKRFLPDGRVKGCYYLIGTGAEAKERGMVLLCEGFATGATLREATGLPVVACFTAGNLLEVAKFLRSILPDVDLVVCGDVDKSGTGQRAATEAAKAVNGLVALPTFTPEELAAEKRPSDWNDYAGLRGPGAVKTAIDAALKVGAGDTATDEPAPAADPDGPDWPPPQPLAAKVEPEPYPLDALPDTIRAAVIEVQAFTKAPVPMVAGAALAALSLAIQSYADIKRADKLHSPVGLFLLTIADSGERKSTCDGFFTSAIRDYQAEQAELAKPEQEKHRAKLSAWEAKRTGMLDAIKQASKGSKSTAHIERDLHQHEQDKPEAPRVPKLLRGDDTPENLAFVLAREWPAAGAISAEGGIIFGSHGMGSESAMRNLALLNILWDGGTLDIGRRSKESFSVKGARLTVALQVQEPTLREFFAKSGALARGTGFLARFLVAWPESTQGFRPFTEAPANWPHLAEFNRRIAAILNQPAPIDDNGALTPAMMTLAPEAKRAWVAFYDAIESELASGGELYDVRDVASKSADNAARLSALFQVFEHGTSAAVGLDCFEGASRIAAWHLHESRRFFGELALPAELADAARLDTWLIEYCRRKSTLSVVKNYVRQHGPLRDGKRLDAAIRELVAFERLKLDQVGKHLTISLNPGLVA